MNDAAPRKVLVVGNCSPDNYSMKHWMGKHFDVEYHSVDGRASALTAIDSDSFELILINRVFDRDGGSGLDLVQELVGAEPQHRVMLISNFADAQAKAQTFGALPGFGKSELHLQSSVEKVASALAD